MSGVSSYWERSYGALVPAGMFVLAGAFVVAGALEEGGVDEELVSWLQPVITALKARPNSTTKDSFFIYAPTLVPIAKIHK